MAVDLKDTSKHFLVGVEKIAAVDAVTMQVPSGQMACVYGASGSGKTTLINVMAGIETVGSGSARVAGTELAGLSERSRAELRLRDVGVIFQTNNLLPELTAEENVTLPLLVRGVSTEEAHDAAREALVQVGLAELERRRPGQMSGGQRQRVGIARALAGKQGVILADEPSGALDSHTSLQIFALLRSMCTQHGTTVVLATHDPLARPFADKVFQMVDGRVEAA